MRRILAASPGWLIPGSSADHGDRAGGPFQDATTDCPKQQPDEPATSPRSHGEQACALGLLEELDDRITAHDVGVNQNIWAFLRPAGQQPEDQGDRKSTRLNSS